MPALVMGLNGGILAAWLGLPSLRRQQHPKRVPRPQSQHRAVPHLVPSVSQPEHPQLWRSTAPEDLHLLLLFVSPVPGRSPSTQHQCYCHLLSAALALTAAGPRVTARVGLLRTQGWHGASAQYLLLSTAPSLTQSFAQAFSLSRSLTQTSYLHTVSTVEPPQSLPAAGNQHCDNFSKSTPPHPAGRDSQAPCPAMTGRNWPGNKARDRQLRVSRWTCSLGLLQPCLSLINPHALSSLPREASQPLPCPRKPLLPLTQAG